MNVLSQTTNTLSWRGSATPWRRWLGARTFFQRNVGEKSSMRNQFRFRVNQTGEKYPKDSQDSAKSFPVAHSEGGSFRWLSAICQDPEAGIEEAISEALQKALSGWLPGPRPEVAFVFVSSSYQQRYETVLPLLREKLPSLEHVIGCSGYGVLGMHDGEPEECEGQPAFALTLASLPGVEFRTFHVPPSELPDADAPPQAWHTLTGVRPVEENMQSSHSSFVLLSDAGYGSIIDLLAGLDYAYPTAGKIGGLNSTVSPNARRALWQWSRSEDPQGSSHGLKSGGCVGMALQGPLLMDSLVAQGCRPLGEDVYSATQVHKSLVVEVREEGGKTGRRSSGKSPLTVVQDQLLKLEPGEREVAARNLMLGIAPDDFKPVADLSPGDFLVRQVVGADPGSGALVVGDVVRLGQRLRFLVRDRRGAMEDLVSHGVDLKRRELNAALTGAPLPAPLGMLIFTCNGRGRGLYQQPHYDSSTLREYVPVPSAGFFCNGEIGQVGQATHLHGFTCAAAIFRPILPSDQKDESQLKKDSLPD